MQRAWIDGDPEVGGGGAYGAGHRVQCRQVAVKAHPDDARATAGGESSGRGQAEIEGLEPQRSQRVPQPGLGAGGDGAEEGDRHVQLVERQPGYGRATRAQLPPAAL